MQRYSLYIDHQLVSGIIRQLENIVSTCCEELDGEYETYELRTSIYDQFVFQIAATFNSKYGLKQEDIDIKAQELKKFYQLTTKLEGINAAAKIEDIFHQSNQVKKGRPPKNVQAQEKLVEWINGKYKHQNMSKFPKKDLDDIYIPLTNQTKKKVIPVNTYLKIFKKYNLKEIAILARGGKQKTIKDLTEAKNSQSLWKKEQQEDSTLKNQYIDPSQLDSTSELQSDFDWSKQAHVAKISSKIHEKDINPTKRKLRSSYLDNIKMKKDLKISKQNSKKNSFKNIFNDLSDPQIDQSDWNHNLSISNDFIGDMHQNHQIYENSRSFQ